MNPDTQPKAGEIRYPIPTKWNMVEPTLQAEGLISVSGMAERLNIKEDTLLKSLERHSVPILKLSDDRKGWLVNLKTLSAIAYGESLPT